MLTTHALWTTFPIGLVGHVPKKCTTLKSVKLHIFTLCRWFITVHLENSLDLSMGRCPIAYELVTSKCTVRFCNELNMCVMSFCLPQCNFWEHDPFFLLPPYQKYRLPSHGIRLSEPTEVGSEMLSNLIKMLYIHI